LKKFSAHCGAYKQSTILLRSPNSADYHGSSPQTNFNTATSKQELVLVS